MSVIPSVKPLYSPPLNLLAKKMFDHFVVLALNRLQPGVAFLIPSENIRKPFRFLIFSGGIEKQYQAVIG